MKTNWRIGSIAAALLLAAAQAGADDTWRCGSALVSTGDRPFEVENKCGEPVQRDLVGYLLNHAARRELVIEEWLYGPSNGMYTVLRFEGNRLVEIERIRDR